MLGIAKALNGINSTLITLQQNIHIDLVQVKEEIRRNNENVSLMAKEIKKANENIEKHFEYVNKCDEMLAKNEEDADTINSLMENLKGLKEILKEMQAELEYEDMKETSQEIQAEFDAEEAETIWYMMK